MVAGEIPLHCCVIVLEGILAAWVAAAAVVVVVGPCPRWPGWLGTRHAVSEIAVGGLILAGVR